MGMQLTEKQQRALEFIQSEIVDRGRPPTLREIGGEIGVSSTNGVRYVLDALVRKGYLERSPMLSRGIELTDRSIKPSLKSGVRDVPILGRIAAGIPITATENHEGRVTVDRSIAPTDDTFALRVRGESMIEAGIHEGDVIFARPQRTADSGDIVVAMIGEEATVKYYKPVGSRILLEPANSRFKPIIVETGTPGFQILGKVVGLMRKF
ncbi:MAG: transcriptional repressor LexA [Calditrichaeota bacterium]|nr:transcriptional repressor LexA [Calditrichota bacterium]MCB9368440.1 transcriptional repressor LexA [Calditrichota bacterium]